LIFFTCELAFPFAAARGLALLAALPLLAEDAAEELVAFAGLRSGFADDVSFPEASPSDLSSDSAGLSPTKSLTFDATVPNAEPTLRATFDNALSCSGS
jgi:hypothetical protein